MRAHWALTGRRLLSAGLLLVSGIACSPDAAGPTDVSANRSQAVTATLDAGTLRIENHADFTVRVGVLETEYARTALALWCLGGDACGNAIAPGGTLRLPLAEIAGYRPDSEELLVHWWDPRATDGQVMKFAVRT